jgi:hypothetical protein
MRLRSPDATRLGGGWVGSPPVGPGGRQRERAIFFLRVGNHEKRDKTRQDKIDSVIIDTSTSNNPIASIFRKL